MSIPVVTNWACERCGKTLNASTLIHTCTPKPSVLIDKCQGIIAHDRDEDDIFGDVDPADFGRTA